MTKRDMDERFSIEGHPEDALRVLLGAAECTRCHHRLDGHDPVCVADGCECEQDGTTDADT